MLKAMGTPRKRRIKKRPIMTQSISLPPQEFADLVPCERNLINDHQDSADRNSEIDVGFKNASPAG
jgi:hypothetical protein